MSFFIGISVLSQGKKIKNRKLTSKKMFKQHLNCNTNIPFCRAILVSLDQCLLSLPFSFFLSSQHVPKNRSTTWGVERKRGKEVRISNEGYHALVTAESCYYPPPSLPVLIVLLSQHGYFQSDVLFDLYFNYFRASKRKNGSILNIIVEHAPKI